jgi:hypothetical protein
MALMSCREPLLVKNIANAARLLAEEESRMLAGAAIAADGG